MKYKYLWDEWTGEGNLPENTCHIEFRNGTRYIGDCSMFHGTHEDVADDIVSYCVAFSDDSGEGL